MGKLFDHQQNMILNVMSPDDKVQAVAPSKSLLKVMNQLTLAEIYNKANTIMKKNRARINLSLVLVKVLYSREQNNDNCDNLSKLFIFFLGLYDYIDDQENLYLQLKFTEGKLSNETINVLTHCEYFILLIIWNFMNKFV